MISGVSAEDEAVATMAQPVTEKPVEGKEKLPASASPGTEDDVMPSSRRMILSRQAEDDAIAQVQAGKE
jgi:hypothetical protein